MPRLKLLQITILLSIFISISAIIIGGGGKPSFDLSSDSSGSSSSEEGYGGKKGHHHHHHGGGHHHPHKPRPPPPTQKPVAKCEDGWYVSNRTQGVWCMKVGLAQLDYTGSQALCGTFGAVLSGLQLLEERLWVAAEATRQLVQVGLPLAGVWLGGMKVSGNNFQWNDGNTVGTDIGGMLWGPYQPNNAFGVDPKGPQNCMQLIVLAPAFWSHPNEWREFPNAIDDYWCHMTHDPATRMYVCGKKATVG